MKFKKKPVVVDAIQYNGSEDNFALQEFAGYWVSIGPKILITTLEGHMEVSPGDYVIKGVKGEFYPCKPDIFKMSYDEVVE